MTKKLVVLISNDYSDSDVADLGVDQIIFEVAKDIEHTGYHVDDAWIEDKGTGVKEGGLDVALAKIEHDYEKGLITAGRRAELAYQTLVKNPTALAGLSLMCQEAVADSQD